MVYKIVQGLKRGFRKTGEFFLGSPEEREMSLREEKSILEKEKQLAQREKEIAIEKKSISQLRGPGFFGKLGSGLGRAARGLEEAGRRADKGLGYIAPTPVRRSSIRNSFPGFSQEQLLFGNVHKRKKGKSFDPLFGNIPK